MIPIHRADFTGPTYARFDMALERTIDYAVDVGAEVIGVDHDPAGDAVFLRIRVGGSNATSDVEAVGAPRQLSSVGEEGGSRARSIRDVDLRLDDKSWIAQSEAAFTATIDGFLGSPEAVAEGGELNYGSQNFGVACFFYAKAIDMLDTAYGFNQMQARQPSAADTPIVHGYVNAVGVSVSMHPGAVDALWAQAEAVVAQLNQIGAVAPRAAASAALYLDACQKIAFEVNNATRREGTP